MGKYFEDQLNLEDQWTPVFEKLTCSSFVSFQLCLYVRSLQRALILSNAEDNLQPALLELWPNPTRQGRASLSPSQVARLMSELNNNVRFALAKAQRSQFSWEAARPAWPEASCQPWPNRLLPLCLRHLSPSLLTRREGIPGCVSHTSRPTNPRSLLLIVRKALLSRASATLLPLYPVVASGYEPGLPGGARAAACLGRTILAPLLPSVIFPPSTTKPPDFLHLLPLPLQNTP